MGTFLSELKRRIGTHNVTVVAAGVAFYGLLTIIPVLTAIVSSYVLVTDNPSEIQEQVTEAAGALDADTQELVSDIVSDIVDSMKDSAPVVVVLSVAIALFTASGTLQKVLAAVNLAYGYEETRPGWLMRIFSFALTTAAVVLVVILLALISALPIVLDQVDLGSATEATIGLVRLPVAILLFVGALTVLYRHGPRRIPRTPWLNPGAFVGGGLFLLFAAGLSFYTNNVGSLPASYGLLGGIAVIMIFFQLTAVAVIVGAEINDIVETQQPSGGDTAPEASDDGAKPMSRTTAMATLAAVLLSGRRPD